MTTAPPRGRRRDPSVVLVLGLVLLVHATVTLLWLNADTWSIHRVFDAHHHYANIATISTDLALGHTRRALTQTLTGTSGRWATIGLLPSIVAATALGATPLVVRAANVVYFALLLLAVYRIGAWCHGKRAGLLAAALVSLMPAAYGGWRAVGLDFPSLCATAYAFSCLQRCRGFTDLRAAALFGLTAGLATLTRGTSLFFLLAPAVWVLSSGLRGVIEQGVDADAGAHASAASDARAEAAAAGPARRRRALLGAALALAALALTSAPWWAGRMGELLAALASHSTGDGMLFHEYDISLGGGVTYYLGTLPYLTSGAAVLLALALGPLFWRAARGRWEILLWILVPLLLHMVLKVRNYRYLFPLVPAVAVVISVGLCRLRDLRLQRLHRLATAITMAAALALWLHCTVALPPPGDDVSRLVGPLRYPICCGAHDFAGPPTGARPAGVAVAARRLARFIGARHPRGAGAALIFVGPSNHADLVVTLGSQLPRLRLALHLEDPTYLTRAPDRQLYALTIGDGPPPTGFTRAALRLAFSDVDILPGPLGCTLWTGAGP